MEKLIKEKYLKYERTGQIAKDLGITNFEVLNFIRKNEKEWMMERPELNTNKRCSLCGVLVCNNIPEPGRSYMTDVYKHFEYFYYLGEEKIICYGCLVSYFENTYKRNFSYLRSIIETTETDLLNFNKYEN